VRIKKQIGKDAVVGGGSVDEKGVEMSLEKAVEYLLNELRRA
jgi:hypothetical protein